MKSPQSFEAEQAVLGCLLIEPNLLPKVREVLMPSDFYRLAHCTLYEVMQEVVAQGQPLDIITLEAALQAISTDGAGQRVPANVATTTAFETCGGSLYLFNLLDAPTTTASWQHYANIVKQKSLLREIQRRAVEVHRRTREPDGLEQIAASNGRYAFAELARGQYRFACFPQPRTIGRFLQEVGEPPPMLIERILPEQRLILCTGKPKLGKSYTSLDIVHGVAAREKVFDALEVNRSGPVLWLQMEDGEHEIAERLRKRGLVEGNDLPIHLIAERIDLSQLGAMDYLQSLHDSILPVLIVIDTARESLGIRKWDDPTEVADHLRPLREFAHQNCSVLLVAHNRKAEGEGGDEIAGSNAFAASVDGWLSGWKAEVLSNGNRRMYYRIEGRGNLHGSLVVEMNTNTLWMRLVSQEELDAEQREERELEQTPLHREVLCQIAHHDGEVTTTWVEECRGVAPRTATRLLKAIEQRGWLADSGERGGKTGRTIVYRLTEAGKSVIQQWDRERG